MKSTCCGERLARLDMKPIVIRRPGKEEYPGIQDTNPLVARWRCKKCGRIYKQHKRQKGVEKVEDKVELMVPKMFVGLDQPVYKSIKYRNEQYTKCYVCNGFVGTTVMYIDNDGSQRHFDCLSEERKQEVMK